MPTFDNFITASKEVAAKVACDLHVSESVFPTIVQAAEILGIHGSEIQNALEDIMEMAWRNSGEDVIVLSEEGSCMLDVFIKMLEFSRGVA